MALIIIMFSTQTLPDHRVEFIERNLYTLNGWREGLAHHLAGVLDYWGLS